MITTRKVPQYLALRRTALLMLASGVLLLSSALKAQPLYQLESELKIPSPTDPSWDYLTFEPSHGYVFIARRADGVLIYDTHALKIIGSIENSKDGNSTTLVPEFDRGYITNEDGSLTIFTISTMKTLERVKVGESADNSFYDPVTKQLLVTMGDQSTAAFVDAKTGKLTGTLHVDSESLEGTAADGKGGYFMALRDKNKVIHIDARTRKITAQYTPAHCDLPNSLAFDQVNQRVFVTCRGEHPMLAVLNTQGHMVASATIGRGNDSMVFDAAAHRIYTANGFDATMVVIDQVDADHYKLAEAVTTRPYARTMTLDLATKKAYLVTAEGTVDPSKPWKTEISDFYPNKYFKDTFTLLTYSRR